MPRVTALICLGFWEWCTPNIDTYQHSLLLSIDGPLLHIHSQRHATWKWTCGLTSLGLVLNCGVNYQHLWKLVLLLAKDVVSYENGPQWITQFLVICGSCDYSEANVRPFLFTVNMSLGWYTMFRLLSERYVLFTTTLPCPYRALQRLAIRLSFCVNGA